MLPRARKKNDSNNPINTDFLLMNFLSIASQPAGVTGYFI